MRTALYGKIKERKGELLIEASTQNLLYRSIVATQHKGKKTKARMARKARRRVSIIGKARRHVGARARSLADSLQNDTGKCLSKF